MAEAIYKASRIPTEIEWAQLASFIDGEGHITIHQQIPRKHPRRVPNLFVYISVSNTDLRLPLWIQDRFGGAVNAMKNIPQDKNWKQPYHWTVGARRAAEILQHCLPFFVLKREQAELALAFHRTIGKHGKRVSEETVALRFDFRNKLRFLTRRGRTLAGETQTIQ